LNTIFVRILIGLFWDHFSHSPGPTKKNSCTFEKLVFKTRNELFFFSMKICLLFRHFQHFLRNSVINNTENMRKIYQKNFDYWSHFLGTDFIVKNLSQKFYKGVYVLFFVYKSVHVLFSLFFFKIRSVKDFSFF